MLGRRKLYPLQEEILPLDPLIKDLVYELRKKGISTAASCQGGPKHANLCPECSSVVYDPQAWILFEATSDKDLRKVVRALQDLGFSGHIAATLTYTPFVEYDFGNGWYGEVRFSHKALCNWLSNRKMLECQDGGQHL